MRSPRIWVPSFLLIVAALTAVFVLGAPSPTARGNPGQAGVEDWPYNVPCPANDPTKKASDRLLQIFNLALDTMASLPMGDPRAASMKLVVKRCYTCATFDGTASGPHAPGHTGSRDAVWAAWQKIFDPATGEARPAAEQDWSACASGLDHAH